MMKKLLVVGSAIFAMSLNAQNLKESGTATLLKDRSFVAKASNSGEKTANISITDTLYYTMNKHFYRNTAANATNYFIYPSPFTTSTISLTHFGAMFQNTGNLTINGLEAMMSRKASSTNTSIPVHVILYNVVAGNIVLPAIDSISGVINGINNFFIGDDFTVPKVVTGDYAVLYRNASTNPGDTIMAWSNNACDPASTNPAHTPAMKFGEGFGMIRLAGNFDITTDIFGLGTDREFVVAPRVQFNAITSATTPTSTPCKDSTYIYTGTTSYWMMHRQYNMNALWRDKKPFANTAAVSAGFPADSIRVWNFGDGTGAQYPATGTNTISHVFASTGVKNGTFTINYQSMADYTNKKYTDKAFSTVTVQSCATTPGTVTAIGQVSGFESLGVYPNPTISGKTAISGLNGNNTIMVYDMLGQLVISQVSDKEVVAIDLSNKANGNYIIKIVNSNHEVKVVKIINQN
jgi:hypothetical protein